MLLLGALGTAIVASAVLLLTDSLSDTGTPAESEAGGPDSAGPESQIGRALDAAPAAGAVGSAAGIETPSTAQEAPAPAARDTAPPDTLYYAVQVAAWTRLSQALDHAAQFDSTDIPSTVTPVPRDSARVWYRVLVGAVSSYSAAAALRERLREDRLIPRSGGVLVRAPYAALLEVHEDGPSGAAALVDLRQNGVPAYIVTMPDGSVRVLVGAFEAPDHTSQIDSVLPAAFRGMRRVAVERVGKAR